MNHRQRKDTTLMKKMKPDTAANSPYFLWHLAALNVIDADFSRSPSPDVLSTVWDQILARAERPDAEARIALIDTGVSRLHPNLASRVIAEDSIDLVTHRFGARDELPGAGQYGRGSGETKRAFFADLDLSGLGPLGLTGFDTEYLEDFVAVLRGSEGVVRRLIEHDELFGAHGTSCAGLMVAEPAAQAAGATGPMAAAQPGATASADPAVLAYFGVDPFSRVFSIRTGFDADAEQFIAAFLYAWMKRADVIVLPRGIPDPVRSRLPLRNYLSASLESYQNREIADLLARLEAGTRKPDPKSEEAGFLPARPWDVLKALILAISRSIPVVCAAGNDGESQVIYPANLAEEDGGVIAVGAISAEGYRSGYSNYGGLTLVAPSDDGEVVNRQQIRQGRPTPAEMDLALAPGQETASMTQIPFSDLPLITTDLPGAFGYQADGQRAIGHTAASRGLYTEFGGTSGAASLIGGLAALMQRARRAAGLPPLDGIELKSVLTDSCFLDHPVRPGTRPPTPDPMNMAIEIHEDLSHFFGAGLPDASVAVGEALAFKPRVIRLSSGPKG